MRPFKALLALIPLHSFVYASPWREDLVDYNLNVNKNAQDPTQYDTYRPNHTYTPSPKNWRELPTYTILMDKFADGDPSNNDYFKTIHEYDIRETQLRYGGDLKGLVSRLDYLHGMGIRVIFMSGTPFLNMPWQADSYSPLDFSVLDPHWGTIQDWRDAIDAIHARGMYFMADFTVSTMSDLIGFQGHLNTSTPFSIDEYNAIWKRPNYAPWNFTEYRDFNIDNTRNFSCQMPKFWADDGTAVEVETNGCLQSDFDQFGDMQAFGAHPDWQRQLSKFASVQDRLREWQPDIMARIQVFSCIVIKALDIDAIRIDKATQITVDALAHWASHTRACAAELGKDNFFIPGEITGGDTFGSLYIGRGRRPTQQPPGPLAAAALKPSQDEFFLREAPLNALDGAAFHYSVYRAFTRFLGLDGSFEVPHDVDPDFVTAWNQMFVGNDLLNALHGHVDPRHMYGSSNFDVFRWPSLKFGVQKSGLATFIGSLVMPGIPLLYYGEEQNFYLYDNGASDYLFGRQAMISNQAWKRHGCYALGSERYFNMPFERALFGCHDDWNTLDHFDPTTDSRLLFAQFNYLRRNYGALQDGFGLDSQGKWTYAIQLPESKGISTEMGLWSVSRSILMDIQENITGLQTPVYMLFTNENRTRSYTMNCRAINGEVPMLTPYASGTTIRNLFSPYESITLQDSGTTGNRGCIPTITMEPYSFKAFVPTAQWIQPLPVVTRFAPGHDARLRANPSDSNSTSVDISFEFNVAMSCDGVTDSLTLNMAGKSSAMPAVANVKCGAVSSSANHSPLSATPQSVWAWSATLVDFPDGVLEIVLNSPLAQTGGLSTGTVDHFMLRKGADDNVMVFPANDYDTSGSFALNSNGKYTFAHKAFGADKFRYSGNYGKDWSDWMNWEENTEIDSSVFSSKENFWIGQHIQVQYWSQATLSAAHMVHADLNYKGPPRRTPRFMARGPFNNWGFDQGVQNAMQLNKDGKWELQIMASWPTYVQLNVWGFDDYFYGDSDGDGVLDRLPPNSVAPNYIRISAPPAPHLSWSLFVDDATLAWSLVPRGQASVGIVMYALLLSIPLISGILAVLIFIWTFYRVRHNQYGVRVKNHTNYFSIFGKSTIDSLEDSTPMSEKLLGHRPGQDIIGWPEDKTKRRKRNFLDPLLGQGLALSCSGYSRVSSISSIVEEKSNSSLNKAIVSFTDADGGIVSDFARKLRSLTAENSEHELSIEKILKKSEETFFGKVRKEKLSSAASVRSSKSDSAWGTPMLSATSFQITLLTGRNWQDNVQLYVLGGVFLAATAAVWYPMFRLKPSVYVLALPWIFFGLGFFLIGLPSVHESLHPAHRVLSSIATWCYAIGSAAGFLFFGLNFGEEAGATTKIWLLRACAVQGSQQIWVAALWYWGYNLNGRPDGYITPWWIVIIVWPLALVSFLFTYLMFHGLPEYYRQTPPKVPHFVRTLFRRKLVLWFLASEILRDYWLSGPYGRNWTFLWSVPVPKWQILLLVIAFFVFVWAGMLRALTHFSRTHDWLLPIFAVGLGAPRWCQMLWGTSSLALYIPWAGHAGPYLGVSLWLWLGVLDAIQGVGLGMILLQTLSRLHVCATLAFAQVIGSICVMVARATAPDALSPGSVFPDAARWDIADGLGGSPMALPLFWVALVCQLVIVFGYFWFYRKEQLELVKRQHGAMCGVRMQKWVPQADG
ncbi:glycoside hydrolase [Agrocybe pediades]|nr:glycoside hydrolase [Agrocybe pediades]